MTARRHPRRLAALALTSSLALTAALTATLTAGVALSTPAAATEAASSHPGDALTPQAVAGQVATGQVLAAGSSVRSANGRYLLAVQGDGNVVVYAPDRAIWSSGTNGNPGARLAVQSDGNVVVYAASGRALWASRTSGANAVLAMQDDGNLVVYSGGRPLWWTGGDTRPVAPSTRAELAAGQALSSGESLQNNGFHLLMQPDGNLVGRASGDVVGWSSGTAGNPGATVVLQGDGNLVVYSVAGKALWASGTSGGRAGVLALQSDGNLVLYRGDGSPAWFRWLHYVSSVRPLTAAEISTMTGVSWRAGCPVPPSALAKVTVLHRNFAGEPVQGTLVVNASVATSTVEAFGDLYRADYPVRRMEPIEAYGGSDDASMAADNTSAFNCRPVAGSTSWSRHAYGTAIDINPVENPYLKGSIVSPPAGASYVNRAPRPGVIVAGDSVVRAFESRGWTWGGRWTSPIDYQHFQR